MPVEIHQTWGVSTGSTAGAAVYCYGYGLEAAIYVQSDSASSGTIGFQVSQSSAGPWVTMVSTKVDTNAAQRMTITGPLLWVRPVASGVSTTVTVTLVAGA